MILLGLEIGRQRRARRGGNLHKHWTNHKAANLRGPLAPTSLAGWQKWFVEKYPDQPEPKLAGRTVGTK